MGTRGFKAWRFRKRYYFQYNHWDSYPEGLGSQIASEIPLEHEQYISWLAAQRKQAENWESRWDDYLTVDPDIEDPTDDLDFMDEYHPSRLVPLNDTYIEWYLDQEISSVNNGAHFKLEQVPHINWIAALADGGLGDKIVLPGKVPAAAVATLVAEPSTAAFDVGLEALAINQGSVRPPLRLVKPKTIADIPWRRRHGPLLFITLFYLWSSGMEDSLAANLLQWTTTDESFREVAFATLCFAARGEHLTVIPTTHLEGSRKLGAFHTSSEDPKFIGQLAVGAHLRGYPPGSAPEGSVYWLDGVLIFLVTQLYRPQAIQHEVARAAKYCHHYYPNDCVDAILMSIEHVVLVHIVPGVEVQHTALLPMFSIPNHLTMDVRDRYAAPYLEKLTAKDEQFMKKEEKKQMKAYRERMLRTEGINMQIGDSDDEDDSSDQEESALYTSHAGIEGHKLSTFYALDWIFEAAARRHMPPTKPHEGVFPNEIYSEIMRHVTDKKTRNSCMAVSRMFRTLCQESLLVTEGMFLEPSQSCEDCKESGDIAEWYNLYDLSSGESKRVSVKRSGDFLDMSRDVSYYVAVATDNDKKSLLSGLNFRLPKSTK